MNSETKKAYWAGLLDGEGTIGLYTHNQPHGRYRLGFQWNAYVRIYLSGKKGKEILQQLLGLYVGRVRAQPPNDLGNRQVWGAIFDSCIRIKPLLEDLLPYLKVKKKQAELLLEYCNLRGGARTPVENDLPKIVAISEEIIELNTGHGKNSHTKAKRKKWVRDKLDSCSL